MNRNTPKGLRCKICGAQEGFAVAVTAFATIDEHDLHGYGDFNEICWTEDSDCVCRECGHAAPIHEFL